MLTVIVVDFAFCFCVLGWCRLPEQVAHGTTVESGLQIAKTPGFVASKQGKCGRGAYGFEAALVTTDGKFDKRKTITIAWNRSRIGGYNSVLPHMNHVLLCVVVVQVCNEVLGKTQFATSFLNYCLKFKVFRSGLKFKVSAIQQRLSSSEHHASNNNFINAFLVFSQCLLVEVVAWSSTNRSACATTPLPTETAPLGTTHCGMA